MLSVNKLIEFRQMDTHTDTIRVFLWCHNYWGIPFGGFCDGQLCLGLQGGLSHFEACPGRRRGRYVG